MPGMDDFYAFKSPSGSGGNGGGSIFLWILVGKDAELYTVAIATMMINMYIDEGW